MKINVIQQDIIWGSPEENCSKLDSLLGSAPAADVYVLPEMFTTGFATLPDARVETEPAIGFEWMKRKSQQLDAAIAGSIALQPSPEQKCVNRFYFVTPDGNAIVYDKRHLFGYGGEGERFNAGRWRVVVEFRGVRFLLAVCYDLRFPVWLRNHGDYDAMIIVASWPSVRRFAWDMLLRARAIENQCFVIASNRVGTDPVCEYSGGSCILNPYGETIRQAGDGVQEIISSQLDMQMLESFRKKFPVLEGADDFEIRGL